MRGDIPIGFNDVLRFILEIFAIVTLGIWGFVAWPFGWNILVGILAPVMAIVLWALFRSPKAVLRVDPFVKALVEIVVFATAAYAWWDLGQPVIAVLFAMVATASGVINGRKEFA